MIIGEWNERNTLSGSVRLQPRLNELASRHNDSQRSAASFPHLGSNLVTPTNLYTIFPVQESSPNLGHFQFLARISRTTQAYVLLGLAFLPFVASSLMVLSGRYHPHAATEAGLLHKLLIELIFLLALYISLASQNRGLASIGFSPVPTRSDIANSLLLFLWALLWSVWGRWMIADGYRLVTGYSPTHWRGQAALFGTTVGLLPFLIAIVNPFFEELLVRAFLITEVEHQFGSVALAASISIVLQASYHLYQGLANALTVGIIFTIYTVFYVKTRRILPVILAHMYMDLYATAWYALSLHQHR